MTAIYLRGQYPLPHGATTFLWIFGAVSVWWGVLAFRAQRRFLGKALRATGVVQSLKKERMKSSTVYFPVIRFTTASGATVTATSQSSKSSGYPIGQPIKVLYDPDEPENLEIDAFWSRWLVVIAATFVALLCFAIGAAALLTPVG